MADRRDESDGTPVEQPEGQERADDETELPDEVVEEVERLTRLARRAVDENEREAYLDARAKLLDEHDFRARVREDEHDVLVVYPDEWVEDGTVQTDQIADTSRATERPLEGPGTDDWEVVEAHNSDIVDAVEDKHGPIHGANARALADFMGNHYCKRIEDATAEELEEFQTDYFPRNAWPTEEQQAVLEESLRLVFEVADAPSPLEL